MEDRTPSERHLLRLDRRTRARRWRRKPCVTLSDVAAWLFFTLLTAAVLLTGCILLTLLWPAP
jgi:hypothetical protein